MKRTLLFIATAGVLVTTTGCFDKIWQKCQDVCSSCCGGETAAPQTSADEGTTKTAHGSTIDAETLKNRMETDANLLVINVLAEEYFNDCHIVGSVNMPVDHIEALIQGTDKNTPIVVYCAHAACSASSKAAKALKHLGFTDVQMYEGGMKEWVSLGFTYDGPAEKEYLEAKK